MEIRVATPDDLPEIMVLVGALNVERVKMGEPDYTKMHEAIVSAAVKLGLGGVYVAEDQGNMIGFSAMVHMPLMPDDMAEGVGTYVLPEVRRTKVAHELGVACREFHRDRGAKVIRGSVYLTNGPSLARCVAEGARVVGFLLEYDIDTHKD